jgi:L-aminopeptidase/D-esterase-like protein
MNNPHWQKTPSGELRARGLGLALPGTPGPFNAITDVSGVAVGYSTIIDGDGPLVVGKGPVRTGVTAILPRPISANPAPCSAGVSVLNGNGEMTGVLWIEENGELQTPITITNSHSCGIARDATLKWMVKNGIGSGQDWGLPVAAETYDGELNDINGFHVRDEHVFAALDSAASGPLELGSVGGGTGMICYDFKAGSGSASRLVQIEGKEFTVGVFVQANFGLREELTILGRNIGRDHMEGRLRHKPTGSIIAIITTDAPLMPHQLKRLARRVPMGLARTGTVGHHSSGDLFLAFSTANELALSGGSSAFQILPPGAIDPLFTAVVEATEEAVIDSMVTNNTMVGRDGNVCIALPLDILR